MAKHIAAVLLLVLVGLLAPTGDAEASPHHHAMTTTVATGNAAADEADCPSHPAPQIDIDCCAMGCSAGALPVMAPPRTQVDRGRSDLPAPMLAVLGQDRESLFRPPR